MARKESDMVANSRKFVSAETDKAMSTVREAANMLAAAMRGYGWAGRARVDVTVRVTVDGGDAVAERSESFAA